MEGGPEVRAEGVEELVSGRRWDLFSFRDFDYRYPRPPFTRSHPHPSPGSLRPQYALTLTGGRTGFGFPFMDSLGTGHPPHTPYKVFRIRLTYSGSGSVPDPGPCLSEQTPV